jgi:hypothetical protein
VELHLGAHVPIAAAAEHAGESAPRTERRRGAVSSARLHDATHRRCGAAPVVRLAVELALAERTQPVETRARLFSDVPQVARSQPRTSSGAARGTTRPLQPATRPPTPSG